MNTTRKTAVQRIMEERENRSSETGAAKRKSYYSDDGALDEMNQAASDLNEARSALLKSRDDQRVLENNAKAAENKYKALQGKMRSAWGQEQLEGLRGAYNQNVGELNAAAKKTKTDYEAYTQASSRYSAAKSRLDQWRSTIRDAETIRTELTDVDSRITALERLTMGRSDALGKSMRQNLEQLRSGRKLLQEELDWSEHFYYADMAGNEDYQSLSRYNTTANGREAARALGGMYAETGFGNVVYDYINRNQDAARIQRQQNGVQDLSYLEQMTDDEIGIYNYLYAKEGGQSASKYLEYLKGKLTERQRTKLEETMAQQSRKNPVWASTLSLIAAPAKGVAALGQAADYLADGEIDENAGYNRVSHMSSAIRGEVGKLVESKWGKVGSAAYQLGMSMADSVVNASAANGSGALAKLIIGSGVAADVTIESKDRGLSSAQAIKLGTVAGVAEALMESIGIDELLHMKATGKGRLWKSMASEGLEELGTDVINTAFDAIISKEESQWNQSIRSYITAGESREQAEKLTLRDTLLQWAGDFAGGAVSGGVFGGINLLAERGNGGDETNITTEQSALQTTEKAQEAERNAQIPERTAGIAEQMPAEANRHTVPYSTEGESPQQAKERIVTEMSPRLKTVEEEQLLRRLEAAETDLQISGVLAGAEEEKIQTAQRLAELLGKRILFNPGQKTENGWYVRSEDTIYLNPESGNPVAQVIGHELTHSVEVAETYSDLRRIVSKRIEKTGGGLIRMRDEKIDLYQRNGVTISKEEAEREVIAEYVEKHLLTDEQAIREMVQDSRSLAQRILDWLDGLLAKIGVKNSQERQFVLQARDAYRQALQESYKIHETVRDEKAQTRARMEAYAQGDDEAGDANFYDQWEHDGYVNRLLNDEDVANVQFSFAGENAEGMDREALKEKEAVPFITGTTKSGTPGGTTSTLSVIQKIMEVKRNVGKTIADKQFSISEETGETEQADPVALYQGKPVSQNEAAFQWENLVSLPDMKTVVLPEVPSVRENGKVSTAKVIENGMKNALSVGEERAGKVYVKNRYTGRDLRVDVSSIRHGLNGEMNRLLTNARLGSAIGEIVQNAVPINALNNTAADVDGTYAMAGYATDSAGREFVAIVTVEERSGDVAGIEAYDVTHAVSGRQNKRSAASTKLQGVDPYTLTSEISIAELLNVVKQTYQSILPENVLEHFGETRNDKGYYYGRAQYSISEDAGETEQDDPVAALPWKAQQDLKTIERKLVNGVANSLNVPYHSKREFLQPIVREISQEYLRSGMVSQETADRLFETAYAQGIVVDAEFYDTYKHVKEFLRTNPVTISEQDKGDISDFGAFRKRAMGTLRISKDGTPVDSMWRELQEMAPELFPNHITHPADQLVHMLDVGQSIKRAEYTLERYYGRDAESHKTFARGQFNAAIGDTLADLKDVREYSEQRQAEQEAKVHSDLTQEEVKALYPKLKESRRNYEKVLAKTLLTKDQEQRVAALLRKEITTDALDPETERVDKILAVYEAKMEYEKYAQQIRQWNRSRKAKLMAQAEEYTESANIWDDKKWGILYSWETMERNIRDIVPNKELAEKIIEVYFKPVHDGAAQANRTKNEYRNRIRALNISRKAQGDHVSEAYAVQLLGEAEDNIRVMRQSRGRIKTRDGKTADEWQAAIDEMWQENPQLDQAKIRNAVEEFRKIYNELFEQMNEARIRNGYEPVNYRQGYFPHFQAKDEEGVMALFGKALGIKTEVAALPTSINGLTHTFKPGIRWVGNALERKGFETAYDALEGFDRYIEGVADVIHQTDNIQRLRALAAQARYRTTDEGIKRQIDEIRARTDLSDMDKENRIKEIYENARFALSNFVVELDEYTNLLANKKSRADRNMEQAMGRDMYNLVKAWESRVAANMVAINPGSWITNFIPLQQGAATLDRGLIWKGMLDTLKAIKNDDGFVDSSSFLINRRGSDPLVQTWQQQASAMLSKPMEWIDSFTADSLVRARFQQNVNRGMSEAAAIDEADQWAAGVMADRSKGATPTLFNRNNPLTKMFTQFQLEVKNQLSYVAKDIPREAGMRDKYLAALAAMLFKFVIGAYLANDVHEEINGRRPALDPLGILNDTVGDIYGFEVPNVIDFIQGEDRDLRGEQVGLSKALGNLGGNVLEQMPFTSALNVFGLDIDSARVPVASAIPDVNALVNAGFNTEWSPERRWDTFKDELDNFVTSTVLPFGGSQVKKIIQGFKAARDRGSYSVSTDGEEQLQYPIHYSNGMEMLLAYAKAMTFGKSSFETAQEWVDSGFSGLGAKQTAAYKGMIEAGEDSEAAYDLIVQIKEADKTEDESKSRQQRRILQESELSPESKAIVFYQMMASEKELDLMDQLNEADADMGEVADVLMRIKDADSTREKRAAILNADLDEEEKIRIYTDRISNTKGDLIQSFSEQGVDFDEFLTVQNMYAEIDELDVPANQKATAFSSWINRQGYDSEQGELIRDSFKYWMQTPAEATVYDRGIEYGLTDEASKKLADTLSSLEPEEGEDSVTNVQKWRAACQLSTDPQEQMNALKTVMKEDSSSYKNLAVAYAHDVEPMAFVRMKEILPQFDANGNGSYTGDEIRQAIESMSTTGLVLPGGDGTIFFLTNEQKATLWQLFSASKSAKNNPYDSDVGWAVLEAKQAE